MFRKILAVCLCAGLTAASSGCVALLAGAGGTVLWQGGKVISEESVSRDRAVSAVKGAFRSKNITLTDEVKKNEVTQLRGSDPSHAKVAVDVFETGSRSVRIEIRMGLGEKVAARDLLTLIKRYL